MNRIKPLALLKIGGATVIALALFPFAINAIACAQNIITAKVIRNEMPVAVSRWESSGVSAYRIDVQGFVPLTCIFDARLTVIGNKLVSVEIRENPFQNGSPFAPLQPNKWSNDYYCSYYDLTIASMFKRVEQSLTANPWDASLKVTFDDEFGFVSSYKLRYLGVSDCCTWFKFSNFQPIEDN